MMFLMCWSLSCPELAAKADQKCCAVLICKEAGSLPQKLFAAGADIVYVVSGPEYAEYNTDIYTNVFWICCVPYRFCVNRFLIIASLPIINRANACMPIVYIIH